MHGSFRPRRVCLIAGALLALLASGCSDDDGSTVAGGGGAGGNGAGGSAAGGSGGSGNGWSQGPELPEPVSNNAAAAVATSEGCVLISAYGIDSSLTPGGIHRHAYRWRVTSNAWEPLPDVPVAQGRIAASMVALRGKAYLLGGYSVADNLSETSHPEMLVLDPIAGSWSQAAPLPIAIDDAAVMAWRDRYIVVVSGWADSQQPVNDVQIYDVENDSWSAATPFAGSPVFGHAGALSGDSLLVMDGVGINAGAFELLNQRWLGKLDPNNPTLISWSSLGEHAEPLRYRAAASEFDGAFHFHGGTSQAYNFDGLSYAGGQSAAALATTNSYALSGESIAAGLADKPSASMDHRGLLNCNGELFTVGGMVNDAQGGISVSDAVWRYRP